MKPTIKSIFVLIVLFVALNIKTYSQSESMTAWNNLLDKSELADFFSGVFNQLGVEVTETGEKFTVHHKGDHFILTEGIKENEVDLVVKLKKENINNMAKHGADAQIDENEASQIVSVLFTPLTQASLEHPVLQKPLSKKLSGIEDHLHVTLINNKKEVIKDHTIIYVNKQWLVADGALGTPKRMYSLTSEEALNYQRHLFEAMQVNTAKNWKAFKKWYVVWRENVSVEI